MREQMSSSIAALGHRVLRYGLALVIAWIGGMKFTAYEAQGIAPLVAKSPFRQSDVPHYALIHIFNAWMGTEPRWVSFSFGRGWTILTQGSGSAWGCDLVAWRVAVRTS